MYAYIDNGRNSFITIYYWKRHKIKNIIDKNSSKVEKVSTILMWVEFHYAV